MRGNERSSAPRIESHIIGSRVGASTGTELVRQTIYSVRAMRAGRPRTILSVNRNGVARLVRHEFLHLADGPFQTDKHGP